VLTIITTIFVPLTFIAGVYGMNFDNMPELRSRNGYFVVLGFMFVLVCGMLLYFRKKRWL
jgi:magnesium transporter